MNSDDLYGRYATSCSTQAQTRGIAMKKTGFVGAAASIAASILMLLTWPVSPASAQDAKNINIALVLPMTGPNMVQGTPAVNSIKMAVAEVNAKGFMVGGQKYRFEVSWFDEECKPQAAINATRAALAQVKPLNLIWLGMCSSSALATRQMLLDTKAVVINAVSGTSGFAGPKGNPYLFKIKEEFSERSRSLARYLAARGMKNGVIIAVNSNWGEESARTFAKAAADSGLRIIQTLKYDEQTEEFGPLLAQARAAKPDFIFQASELLNEQVAFLRNYRQLGMKAQLVGESTWTEGIPEKIGWEAIDGMLTAGAWVPSNPRPAVAEYVDKYRKAFGATPGFNGPTSYDMVNITVQALEKAGSLDPEAIRNVLRTNEFKNLIYGTGTLRFDSGGQAQFPVFVTQFDARKKARVLAPEPK
jgi:branched-chain amino acid transport system substrate-binding protein